MFLIGNSDFIIYYNDEVIFLCAEKTIYFCTVFKDCISVNDQKVSFFPDTVYYVFFIRRILYCYNMYKKNQTCLM